MIELVLGASVGNAQSADRALTPPTAAAAGPAPPGEVLGGVPVRIVRELIPAEVPTPGLGPIVLAELVDAEAATDAAATRRALAQIATDQRVARVEPDRVRHLASAPNDPLWPDQWNLPMIHMPAAWELAKGSPDVIVAFLDTGIVYGHPDLNDRLISGYDFISVIASADDGDYSRDPDPTDTGTVETSRLHGTHVAGTIGALTDNGLGIAGVDQNCRLMPVRVLGINNGDGIDSDISDAIRWTTGAPVGQMPRPAQPAHVLNLSFGGPGISFTLQRAIDYAVSQGLLVIAAAGNGADDAATYSPGGLDGVITIGAVDQKGVRAEYSNYGPRVDLLAPGGGNSDTDQDQDADLGSPDPQPDLLNDSRQSILSTYRDLGIPEASKPPFTYGLLAGTSQATPQVSGAAALIKSLWPAVRQRTLAQLLRRTADAKYQCPILPLGGCGTGLLDVESALREAIHQNSCGCAPELYCLEGSCVVPPVLHPSVYQSATLHGGYCALAGPAPAARSTGLVSLMMAMAAAVLGRARRWRGHRQRK